MENSINCALELLPDSIRAAIASYSEIDRIDEIRLRLGRRISLSVGYSDVIIDQIPTAQDIDRVFKTAFSYSLHSFRRELSQGSITTRGGNRVGIAGTAVTDGSTVESVKNISSVNIRIAREIKGCADLLMKKCFSCGAEGVLVLGPPASGKTTLLRDVCRQLGSIVRISVIDEKGELSASHLGIAQNDIGELSDVFFGYPKAAGIETAVRVMSPKAIIVDEIGSYADEEALMFALHSGVKLITAVHAENLNDAKSKPAVSSLLKEKAFRYAAILGKNREAEVEEID